MARYADPHRCPDCGKTLRDSVACRSCGLDISGPLGAELFRTLQRADEILEEMRTAPVLAPEPARLAEPVRVQAPEPALVTLGPSAVAEPSLDVAPPAIPSEPVHKRVWSVPVVLLSLGALCLAIGALIFIAVTWARLGIGGRTAILMAITLAAGLATYATARRGLRGAAETLAALTGLFAVFDLMGALSAGWFGEPSITAAVSVGGVGLALASSAGTIALRTRTGMQLSTTEIGAVIAADAAALAFVEHFGVSWWAQLSVLVLAVASAAAAATARLVVLTINCLAVGAVAWAALVLTGVGDAALYLAGDGDYATGALVASGLVALLLVPSTPATARIPARLRVLAGLVGVWLLVVAVSLPVLDGLTSFTVVCTALAVLAAAAAQLVGERASVARDALRAVTLSAAAVTCLVAGLWLASLIGALVAGTVDAAARGTAWLATYDAATPGEPFAPWLVLLAVVCLGAVALAVPVVRRAAAPSLGSAVAGGAAVLAGVVLGYTDQLLLAIGFLVLIGAAEAYAAARTRRFLHWIPVVSALVAAAQLASYASGPELVVIGLALALAVAALRLGSAVEGAVAACALPPLAAMAAGLATDLVGLGLGWAAAVAGSTALLTFAAVVLAGWVERHALLRRSLGAATLLVSLASGAIIADPLGYGPALMLSASGLAVTAWLLRGGREGEVVVASLATPPLAAASAALAAHLLGIDAPVRMLAALLAALAVALTGVLLGWASRAGRTSLDRWGLYASALVASCLAMSPSLYTDSAAAGWLATYLTLIGAAVAVVGIDERDRPIAGLAAAFGLAALWVRLAASEVGTPEAYTLPLAAVVLAFGGWALRTPAVRTLNALGPGLGIGLVPSLALVLQEPLSVRALLLGLVCAGLVAVGATQRSQAPLLAGALVGSIVVVVESLPYQQGLPRWAVISTAGLVLLAAGIMWERLALAGRRTWGYLADLR